MLGTRACFAGLVRVVFVLFQVSLAVRLIRVLFPVQRVWHQPVVLPPERACVEATHIGRRLVGVQFICLVFVVLPDDILRDLYVCTSRTTTMCKSCCLLLCARSMLW